jgi:hypothetical protein
MGIIANNFTLLTKAAGASPVPGYTYPANALYTESEANTMITTQSYIPVASASELDDLRNSVTQTMGAGTPWEASYTTGLDKKYLIVAEIDWNGSASNEWEKLGDLTTAFTGTFDGNELIINNLYKEGQDYEVFIGVADGADLDNIRIKNATFNAATGTGASERGCLIGIARGGTTIDNCAAIDSYLEVLSPNGGGLIGKIDESCTITNSYADNIVVEENSSSNIGNVNLGGLIGSIVISTGEDVTITGCYTKDCSIEINNGRNGGGFIGYMESADIDAIVISESYVDNIAVNIITTTFSTNGGGFVGWNYKNSLIQECKASGSVVGNGGSSLAGIGGFSGLTGSSGTSSKEKNNYSTCSVNATGTGTLADIGGYAGLNRNTSNVLENCYSIGSVTADSGATDVGGFCGDNRATISNCYWDTDTSGQSTSDGGTGKTTTEMKEGLIDDPDTDGIYVNWDATIWDEGTTSEYPKLQWEN